MRSRNHQFRSVPRSGTGLHAARSCSPIVALVLIFATIPAHLSAASHDKNTVQYGMGLIVNIPFPEAEVTQVVQDVVQNGIIRGTKEYNKDEYVSGAVAATSTHVFGNWTEAGKAFYKVRLKALDPRDFKDSGDVGTLAVRYIVQAQGDKNTVLRIDARFVEDFRRIAHASDGSVESAEYKDIHDRLDALDLMKTQTAEAEQEKQQLAQKPVPVPHPEKQQEIPEEAVPPPAPEITAPATQTEGAPETAQTLEDHVKDLQRQVQRLVKSPGAPLKSAPFHTASTLQSLPTGTEVLIVITTAYWLGVETHEGQHGWIQRDELELLP